MKKHLRHLRRISPCCGASIDHFYPMESENPLCVQINCVECRGIVSEHWLINEECEKVWPPPKEWVDAVPLPPKRKRCRRTVPLDPEPEPYKVLIG